MHAAGREPLIEPADVCVRLAASNHSRLIKHESLMLTKWKGHFYEQAKENEGRDYCCTEPFSREGVEGKHRRRKGGDIEETLVFFPSSLTLAGASNAYEMCTLEYIGQAYAHRNTIRLGLN